MVLERELRDELVLSVYIDGAVEDPAAKRGWRSQLDQALRDVRARSATMPEAERSAFERCARLLMEQIAGMIGAIGAPGWAAFITEAGVAHASRLAVSAPTRIWWGTGMRVSPYIRALKHTKPVVIVLADASEARVYRYLGGRLEVLKPVEAHARKEPAYHLGHPPREQFHSGTRGSTGHDEAHDAVEVATERMLGEVSDRAVRYAQRDGYVMVGGIPRVRAQAKRMLETQVDGRVLEVWNLDVHTTESEILAAADHGASALRNQTDLSRIH
jgi:hypothetical protein